MLDSKPARRLLSFALAAVFLAAPALARAVEEGAHAAPATASASGPYVAPILDDARLLLFEVEAQGAYIETEARISSQIDAFTPTFGQGTHQTETLKAWNVGGAFRVLGPRYGVARPFFQAGGVTPPEVHIFGNNVYGNPATGPTTAATLEYKFNIDAALGIDVSMPLGRSILSLRPYVGFAWDAYVAKVEYRNALAPSQNADTEDEITIGSMQYGGTVAIQPLDSFPVYMFATGGWRQPVQHDKRQVNDDFARNTLRATGTYESRGGVFYRAGVGVRF